MAESIDRADGHVEEAGTWNRAARHIALFWWWAAERGLAEPGVDVAALARAPVRYFARECDGKLHEEDFSDEGAAFAQATYRRYTREVEAYARRLGVDGYAVPANTVTRKHFFAWLDTQLARWRGKRPAARAPAKPAALSWRQVAALAAQRTLPREFAQILADPDGDAGAQAAILEFVRVRRRAWAAQLVPALCALVEHELPRTSRSRRPLLLGEALEALGTAQSPAALDALLALTRARYATPAFRGNWLYALARYRAPAVVRVLRAYADSADLGERTAANVGLARNGKLAALTALRRLLDAKDFYVAREAARQLHLLLGTRFVADEAQLARFIAWRFAAPRPGKAA